MVAEAPGRALANYLTETDGMRRTFIHILLAVALLTPAITALWPAALPLPALWFPGRAAANGGDHDRAGHHVDAERKKNKKDRKKKKKKKGPTNLRLSSHRSIRHRRHPSRPASACQRPSTSTPAALLERQATT